MCGNPKKMTGCRSVYFTLLFLLAGYSVALSQQIVHISDAQPSFILSQYMEQQVDSGNKISTVLEVIKNNRFAHTNGNIPLFPNEIKSVWFRFTVNHGSIKSSRLFLNIAYANLSRVSLYKIDSAAAVLIQEGGNDVISTAEVAGSPNITLNLKAKLGATQQYLLHVYSSHPIIVPAKVVTYDALHESINFQTVVTGLYMGVLAIMFLYNLFLFFATKDNNYLYYVIYIFCLALAQTTLAGYEYTYLWPHHPWLNRYAVIFSSTFSAVSGLVFSMKFLHTRMHTRRMHRFLQLIVVIYLLGLVWSLITTDLGINYNILNYNGLVGVLAVLGTSFYIAKKNFRPAYFYLTAWLFFLVTFIILILRNLAVLPYNDFTTYIIYLGSGLEVALLSIALADKINMLRKEKEVSQLENLRVLEQNQVLIRDQNITLEKNVHERTAELSASNAHLTTTLQELKDTQIQLVEAEKMASLGQLTAGVAHEINNPINFVKSNIGPLKMDINDLVSIIDEYEKLHTISELDIAAKLADIDALKKKIDLGYLKKEIVDLITGIREGADRTAEIVQGLRTFSRLDESEIKTVNIYEGIDSSLILLKNMMPGNLTVEKDYQAKGSIECYPGKLNQLFMNIIGNAIHAIKQKTLQNEREFIFISTRDTGSQIEIRIKDTGVGMSEEVKRKIFDPFFTTKDVGEGTGLGLSIVYKIVQMHQGKIEVLSSEGGGAEFIITLYHSLPGSAI